MSKIITEIDWQDRKLDEWNAYLDRVPNSNLLQTYPYARAIRATRYQTTRFGVIRIDGIEEGIVQIQEVRLFKFIHFVIMDRGPLWFDEDPPFEKQKDFYTTLAKQFPRRLFRSRRIMPELPYTHQFEKLMKDCKFKLMHKGYESIIVDLTRDKETLRRELKGSWRNQLNKSEKENLTLEIDHRGQKLVWLLNEYDRDRWEKDYPGPPGKLVFHLAKNAMLQKDYDLFQVLKDGTPVAGGLVIRHGQCATYQIGWINDKGKKACAHNFMLWNMIAHLKSEGIKKFDLGGINEDTASGVTDFKKGVGGEPYKLIGIYC